MCSERGPFEAEGGVKNANKKSVTLSGGPIFVRPRVHKQQLTLFQQKGSLLATRQGLRNHIGKKANVITTERRARESQKDACG